jgi:hypothetical protein
MVKLSPCLTDETLSPEDIRGANVWIHISISALVGVKWSTSRPGRFTLGKQPLVLTGEEAEWATELVWTTWRGEKSYPHWDSNSNILALHP